MRDAGGEPSPSDAGAHQRSGAPSGRVRCGRQPIGRHEEMMAQPLTILFMPESAYGPTNNCIGIGDVLLKRGHRIVFAAEASWSGRLAPLGFVEDLVDLSPPPKQDPAAPSQDAGRFWKDFIRD